jgi:hypothetical protein
MISNIINNKRVGVKKGVTSPTQPKKASVPKDVPTDEPDSDDDSVTSPHSTGGSSGSSSTTTGDAPKVKAATATDEVCTLISNNFQL